MMIDILPISKGMRDYVNPALTKKTIYGDKTIEKEVGNFKGIIIKLIPNIMFLGEGKIVLTFAKKCLRPMVGNASVVE